MPNLESGNAPFDGADDEEMTETDDAMPAPPRRRAAIQLARYDDDEDKDEDTAEEDSEDEHTDDALDEESDEDADAYDSAGEEIDDTETGDQFDDESDDETDDDETSDDGDESVNESAAERDEKNKTRPSTWLTKVPRWRFGLVSARSDPS